VLTRSNAPPYFAATGHLSCVFEQRSIVRSVIRFCVVAAALAPLACLHAEPADDSLRIYAVDIWQDPAQSWGPGRGVYLGKGLVLTAAHVVGSTAHTKPRVHIAGMELPATAIREGNVERVDLTLLSVDEQRLPAPAGQSPPSLIVTPASSMAFSGPRGGPFSPARFEFRVSSTTGIVSYSIRTPPWLTASPTFGTTDTRGVTITLFHERLKRSGQHDQAGKADYPRVFASSCDGSNRTRPW
jgi:hypothetical protein